MQTILIADDEAGIRELIEMTIEGSGWRVLHAADGAVAYALARNEHPDLIILDWMMPKMNGAEVAERLRAEPLTAHIPIILLTGLNDEKNRKLGRSVGALAFLVKPFSPLHLLEIVEQALNQRTADAHLAD